ncbi:MAG: hypothetical protein ACT4RN_08705 [Pseudonocardia sp.]
MADEVRAPGKARLAVACWIGVVAVFVGNLAAAAAREPEYLRAGLLPVAIAGCGLWGAVKLAGGLRGARTFAVLIGALLALLRGAGLLVLVLAPGTEPVDPVVVVVSVAVVALVAVATWAMFRPEVAAFLARAPAR